MPTPYKPRPKIQFTATQGAIMWELYDKVARMRLERRRETIPSASEIEDLKKQYPGLSISPAVKPPKPEAAGALVIALLQEEFTRLMTASTSRIKD